MIHFDTNFLIRALRTGSHEEVLLQDQLSKKSPLNISVVVHAEFLCGPVDTRERRMIDRLFPTPVSLTKADAEVGAVLFNASGRRKNSLADCLIAATAILVNALLLTANVADFKPFAQFGLRLSQI